MSREPTPPNEPGDDTLARLLAMSEEPPQLAPDARERLLARLTRSRADELSPPAARRGPEPTMLPSSRPAARLRPIHGYALATAAAAALVWGASTFMLPEGTGPEEPGRTDMLAESELINDAARPRSVTLADGSALVLRQGAALRQHGPRRLELLRGEALLEVAPGSEPFTIATAAGEVEVRGTKFLLRQGDDGLLAGVLRGELRLHNAAGSAILQAGESATLSVGSGPVKRPTARLSHEVGWARDAIADPAAQRDAVRRGNLVARMPNWDNDWPLPVRSMDVDVYVEDGVARTTIDQTFFNHTDFSLEGVYSFPLPADAAISRLAMYVDGKRMEAGITERQEGREIYESIVYRRRDPALLEWMQGNEFRMRVFPLPARTEKRILLSYTQPLASLYGDYSVRVPIPELDLPVGTLNYRIHVKDRTLSVDSCCVDFKVSDRGDERLAEATLHDVPLGEDLALTLYPTTRPPAVTSATMTDPDGDYRMVRVRPELPQRSQHLPRRWVVLHDTSASRSPTELAAQSRFLRHLLGELDESDRVRLLAFDSTVRPLSGEFTRVDALDLAAVDEFLAREGRDHVGASALGLAVDEALTLLDADAGPEAPHILYLGDGLLGQAGDAPRQALRERLTGRATFVAAALGDENDLPLLDELTAATGGLRVQVAAGADLRWQALDLAAALNTPRVHDLKATLLGPDGAALPGALHLSSSSAADGEALVILSRDTGASGHVPRAILLEGRLAGAAWSQRSELPPAREGAAYLPRLWASAQIAADLRAGAAAHRERITALGREHFLVTPFTSLLVLENDAMYRQFKVRRPDAAGWAHYDAPDQIAVVHEPRGAVQASAGQRILRQPIGLVGDHDQTQHFGDAWGGLDLTGVGFTASGFGDGTIGLGLTGLIGKGGGGGGRGEPRDVATSFGGRGNKVPSVRIGEMNLDANIQTRTTASPASFFTTDSLRQQQVWERGESSVKSGVTRSSGFFASFGGEARRRGPGHGRVDGRVQPGALHYLADARLGDLGEHLPALFEDEFDRQSDRLLAAAGAAPAGEIDDAARELLTRARASVSPARYAVDGGVLAIEADGRFTRTRDIGGYLREQVRYDGADLIAVYPGLDIAVRRVVGLAEPALLNRWVPWLLPSPESLARWYVVTSRGERGLRLQQRGSEVTIDLELDPQLRVISMVQREGDRKLAETRFEYDDAGLTIVSDGRRDRVERTTAAPPAPVDPATVSTTVSLPLLSDVDRVAELAALAKDDPRRRSLLQQRLASLAALGQVHLMSPVLAELRAIGPLTRGELVLAGGGIIHGADKKLDAALVDLAGDPVADYLTALRRARRGQLVDLEAVAKTHAGTLPGLLAGHARLLADSLKQLTPAALERLREHLARYDHPDLEYIATHQLAGRWDYRRPGLRAAAWEALAADSPRWRPTALHAAGVAHDSSGDLMKAGQRYEQGLAAAVDGGQIPTIDWSVRASIDRGNLPGWHLQWARWRDAVQKSGDADQLLAFIAGARMLGRDDEIQRMLAGAELAGVHAEQAPQVALALVQLGMLADARQVVGPLLAAHPGDPELLALAAMLAERTGDLRGAAELGERALAGQTELPLEQLRAAYRGLFELRARLATSKDMSPKPGERAPLDLALDVAARWRAEDPDNAEIDERCATLLFSLGQPAEAVRHLESIAERHPAEGSAHARVARQLEREGRFEDADLRWQQAVAVEPTDPTWLIGRANNQLARGDVTQARALVEQVLAGDWQDRFWQPQNAAKELKKLLAERAQ